MSNLENRVALVTGASRGIGKAIALALAKAGCNVAVNYRLEHEAARRVVEEIRKNGRVSKAFRDDVSTPTAVDHLMGDVVEMFGEVHILVNNAGIAISKPTEDLTLEDWQHTIYTNLTSAFLLIQLAVRTMKPGIGGASSMCRP